MEYALFALLIFCIFREVLMYRERREWAAERRLLMMRVQAPEVAVRMDGREAAENTGAPKNAALPFDDDDAFNAYKREVS